MGSYCVSGEVTHRDHEILSSRPVAYLDLQSRFAGFTQQRCLRQRHGAHRAAARAARNGGAASKTRLTKCEAQTAMASSHRAASWIRIGRTPATSWHGFLRRLFSPNASTFSLSFSVSHGHARFLRVVSRHTQLMYPSPKNAG